MCLCQNFTDPAEAPACKAGVNYAALAGGGAFYMIVRLPCVPISNRRGEVPSRCPKYQPETERPSAAGE